MSREIWKGNSRRRFIWSALVTLVLMAAQSATPYAPDRESCEKLADHLNWNIAEKFVWRCACTGIVANFNESSWKESAFNKRKVHKSRSSPSYLYYFCRDNSNRLISGESRCWQDRSRQISLNFLETILYHKPFQEAVTRFGVQIEGAHFTETINLQYGHILWPLRLVYSRFERSLDMSRVKTDHLVELSHSYLLGQISLGESFFGHYLYLRHTTSEHLNLGGIHVKKHLDLDHSRVLDLGGAVGEKQKKNLTIALGFVGTNLHMQNVEADRAYLRWVRVGDLLTMRGTAIFDTLNMKSAVIGGNLHMHRVKVGKAHLDAIKVGGLLSMENSLIFNILDMKSVVVGSQLLMNCMRAFGKVNVTSATIESNLDLSHAIFDSLFTSDPEAGTERIVLNQNQRCQNQMGKYEIETARKFYKQYSNQKDCWSSAMDLQQTKVSRLISTPDSWTDNLTLGGLIYNQHATAGTRQWSVEDYIDWLGKNRPFSLQPYEQLASVLRTVGRISDANAVLYEGREQERKKAEDWWTKLWLWVWGKILGHGVGLQTLRATSVLLLLSLVGWLLLWLTGERWKHNHKINGPIGFWFSVDYVLPAIRLRSAHYEKVELPSRSRISFRKLGISCSLPFPLRGYFYLHQIISYALMFFIIAGLSGVIR